MAPALHCRPWHSGQDGLPEWLAIQRHRRHAGIISRRDLLASPGILDDFDDGATIRRPPGMEKRPRLCVVRSLRASEAWSDNGAGANGSEPGCRQSSRTLSEGECGHQNPTDDGSGWAISLWDKGDWVWRVAGDVCVWIGVAGGLRQCGESDAGTGGYTRQRDRDSIGHWRRAWAD